MAANGQVQPNSGNGFAYHSVRIPDVPAACLALIGHGNPASVVSCLTSHGYRGFITYQPASRYWTFQGIETGIFVFLTAALLATAALVIARRDA